MFTEDGAGLRPGDIPIAFIAMSPELITLVVAVDVVPTRESPTATFTTTDFNWEAFS